jgi:hypothetical protein
MFSYVPLREPDQAADYMTITYQNAQVALHAQMQEEGDSLASPETI